MEQDQHLNKTFAILVISISLYYKSFIVRVTNSLVTVVSKIITGIVLW